MSNVLENYVRKELANHNFCQEVDVEKNHGDETHKVRGSLTLTLKLKTKHHKKSKVAV